MAEGSGQQPPQQPSAPPPRVVMFKMVTGYWVSQAIGVAARLGVADQLTKGPRPASEIASAVGADADSLGRLLRMLASIGVFAQPAPGTYGLTPLSELLRSDVPGSMRPTAVVNTDAAHWLPWGRLIDSVKHGRSMTTDALGMDTFAYYAQDAHADDAAFFNAAMNAMSMGAAGELTRVYDFSGVRVVADVGGGHGVMLAGILKAVPTMRGILFELPSVIATAQPTLAAHGVADRCQLVAGDFFESVPEGADLHLLKHVIHNWDDEPATRLLKSCHKALPPGGKVVLVEMVVPPDNQPSPAQPMDLNMMVNCGGRERTADEYRALLATAGFKMERVLPTQTPFSVIEASRA
jgi:SAM-dependent methyltransferase